ncbi:MAG: SixA phosphatase family protein [Flectobacillus sp.]|uniref:SixA phosphatase family protein n=1 Tax=Flectobacillus sp. TaxID=50419 RepID=UPI003B9D3956
MLSKIIFASLFLGMLSLTACQTTQKIYVVRHAEKDVAFQGNDRVRPLNAQGHQRAGALNKRLAKAGIQKIFVTEYLRVQQTADSLRIKNQIDTLWYSAKDAVLSDNLEKAGVQNKTVLIVGHSNTVPDIIRKFGVNFETKILPDTEYDNLYIISRKKGKVLKFEASKY